MRMENIFARSQFIDADAANTAEGFSQTRKRNRQSFFDSAM
jgi:hypothetical protein